MSIIETDLLQSVYYVYKINLRFPREGVMMSETDTTRRSLLRTISALPAVGVAGAAFMAESQAFAAPAAQAVQKAAVLTANELSTSAPTAAAPRGTHGLFTRMDDLDLESYQDYLCGRGKWMRQIFAATQKRGEAILRAHGIDPTKPSDISLNEVVGLLYNDPIIARSSRLGLDNTYDAFSRLRNHFHANGDYYYGKLSAADKKGPGVLELNPSLQVPDYTKHEIHNQVGGYMGDPFAGMTYFYGTLVLNDSANEQDGMFDAIANAMPAPADGKIMRILDNGTGPGQLATSLKRRFPNAEVWGIDVSGPMVRYAHMRANDMGVNVNFAQRLAEDNGFPDNYFDLITSSSFHHEVTADASKKIFSEVQRVLRPGGIFRPADSGINGYAQAPQGKVHTYVSQRVNHEVWMLEWGNLDRIAAMKDTGLRVDPEGAKSTDGGAGWWLKSINLVATKV